MPRLDLSAREQTSERFWRCPACGSVELVGPIHAFQCDGCGVTFGSSDGRPVLLAPDNQLFAGPHLPASRAMQRKPSALQRLFPDPSVNLSYEPAMRTLASLLIQWKPARILIVGSGHQRAALERLVAHHGDIRTVALDVDPRAELDVVGDASSLPFADETFHAVVATAVLEHVIDPDRAMGEIHRVLTPGGLLYSEIPFIQQVHEGAYDFTRFTLSGHRRLARGFDELDSGAVAGPATALGWTIEHFALTVAGGGPRRMSVVKALVRASLFWLKHLDRYLAGRPAGLDAASCTYFLGRKRTGEPASDASIVARYSGAQIASLG